MIIRLHRSGGCRQFLRGIVAFTALLTLPPFLAFAADPLRQTQPLNQLRATVEPAAFPGVASMLSLKSRSYGRMPDGAEVTAYTLSNGTVTAELINLGATLTALHTPDRAGKPANITLGFADLPGYIKNNPYFGVTCGRYANRIALGKFSIDGKSFTLATNNGPNHLHGGLKGINRYVWASRPAELKDAVGVTFTLTSPDGDEGYPGALGMEVTYSLNAANELAIDYRATTDQPTVLNLTNHAYWNLSGDATKTIHDHELTLMAARYLPVDETSIPTGELAPVTGTPMDFLKPTTMGARITQTVNGGGGYDHCYVVDGDAGKLRPAAKIVHPASGRVMDISTTEPGIQFYTGNYLNGTPETGHAVKQGAFCLETQHFPDSPNRPDFPTTLLRPGQVYRQTTVHKFSVAP
jgi:aldose 1-epimerase